MSDTNLVAVAHAKNDLRLEHRPIPEPGPGQVLLEMQQVGICGSDVHFLTKGCIGDFVVKAPMVLGHEASGLVSKLGPGVTSLRVGDRVAIEPGVSCRTCNVCKSGRYNLCKDVRFCATPPDDGNLSRYFVHDADFCFKLPDHVSFEEGALLEPLAVAVHATNRAGVKLGHTVLICGAGPIGLVHILTCKAKGASVVCVTDINESRLKVAKELGADYVVKVTTRDPQAIAKAIEDAVGDKVDISMECSGVLNSQQAAVYTVALMPEAINFSDTFPINRIIIIKGKGPIKKATKSGGTVVTVGYGHAEAELPIVNACVREVDIKGTHRYANCYPTALAMVASEKVNVKPLVTHRFSLEESIEAFETAKRGEGIKVMIKCSRG